MVTSILGCTKDQADPVNICGEYEAITGVAYVADGDTITVNEQKIRLMSIDAPELKQLCESKSNHETYECGIESKRALEMLLEDQEVTCCKHKLDVYKRLLAECFVGDTNINKQMVALGQAILYRNAKAYQNEQEKARQEKLGIWSSFFENPIEWRKSHKRKAK